MQNAIFCESFSLCFASISSYGFDVVQFGTSVSHCRRECYCMGLFRMRCRRLWQVNRRCFFVELNAAVCRRLDRARNFRFAKPFKKLCHCLQIDIRKAMRCITLNNQRYVIGARRSASGLFVNRCNSSFFFIAVSILWRLISIR